MYYLPTVLTFFLVVVAKGGGGWRVSKAVYFRAWKTLPVFLLKLGVFQYFFFLGWCVKQSVETKEYSCCSCKHCSIIILPCSSVHGASFLLFSLRRDSSQRTTKSVWLECTCTHVRVCVVHLWLCVGECIQPGAKGLFEDCQ